MIFDDFVDRHRNSRAFIIGKGPSIDRMGEIKSELSSGCILCISEAIRIVESLDLDPSVPVYSVQQDCTLGDRGTPRRPGAIHLMNEFQTYPENSIDRWWVKRRVTESPWDGKAILYDPGRWLCDSCTLTSVICVHIAKHMGAGSLRFIGFDSWHKNGSLEYAKSIGRSNTEAGSPQRFLVHKQRILEAAAVDGFADIDTMLPGGGARAQKGTR